MPKPQFIQAFPRRGELLDQIGVRYTVCAACVDETSRPGESPPAYAMRLVQAKAQAALSTSRVCFRKSSAGGIAAYWRTGELRDKAYRYAGQGLGVILGKRLQGSFSGVLGLPLYETARLLRKAGIEVL